jgi:alpha-galactosidase
MMIVGLQRSFGTTHPTYLTPNEQYTHVSLWAMMCSPLLIGTDLTKLDPFTKSLLTNPMVVAISQDTLGKPARRIRHVDTESVWTRPLANGDIAVALVNRYPFAREISVDFSELGIGGEWYARDQWTHKCEGRHAGRYLSTVPAHGTKLVRMRKVDCPKCD